MSIERKACPFCGKDATEVKHSGNWGYFVRCKCTAVGPGRNTKEGAIEAWNTRVEPLQGRLI